MKKLKELVRLWWKKHIVDDVPEGYEDMFDEYFERDKNGNVKKRKTWTN